MFGEESEGVVGYVRFVLKMGRRKINCQLCFDGEEIVRGMMR